MGRRLGGGHGRQNERAMPTREEHESGLAMFLAPARRSRFREALGSEKSRRKLRGRLAHFRDLDERFAEVVPRDADAATVFGLLTSAGAPETCSVFSEDPDLDGRALPLRQALEDVLFSHFAAFVSCLPGRLALFSDEAPGDQWLLRRDF